MTDLRDELVQFIDNDNETLSIESPTWPILLVDDEPDVHAATKLSLKNLTIEGRKLSFSHAYSATEARELLAQNPNFSVAIIDVVMETEDAGLRLVHHIRHDLKNHNLRIILRTGQPGYAPEIHTIEKYDINDYCTKTELTQTRLYTSLTIAIRSHAHIQQIELLAYQDALVCLPNRNAMLMALDQEQNSKFSVALIDLDNFADINSILDDNFGDAVLKSVAKKLRDCFSESTLVARLGSDLFGLYGPSTEVNPSSIAAAFADPFSVDQYETLRLSATTGLVKLTDSSHSGAEIIKNAGAALKQAKRLTRGKALYFKAEQSIAARDRITMLNMLRTSLSEQHLELYYQPFICLNNNKVIGAECLLRWQTPDGNFIPPDVFIPIAEQSGLMIAIGEWVIRTALIWRKQLESHVDDKFRIAINVSHTQFAEPDFINKLLRLLKESKVSGHHVEIELTESIAIENFDLLKEKLEQLQSAGIHIAMDDFGTGYSSLNVLQRLKLNRLKIDRSFVSGDGSNTNFEMAKTIISMANHLELKTIAEGIEKEEQKIAMLTAGCKEGQGYLFSKPLPEIQFLQWLNKFQEI